MLFEHGQIGKITSVTTGFTVGNIRTVLEVEIYTLTEVEPDINLIGYPIPGVSIVQKRTVSKGRTVHLSTALAWLFEPLPTVVRTEGKRP